MEITYNGHCEKVEFPIFAMARMYGIRTHSTWPKEWKGVKSTKLPASFNLAAKRIQTRKNCNLFLKVYEESSQRKINEISYLAMSNVCNLHINFGWGYFTDTRDSKFRIVKLASSLSLLSLSLSFFISHLLSFLLARTFQFPLPAPHQTSW